MSLFCPPILLAAAKPASVSYRSNASGSNLTTFTFSGLDIGTAATTRRVIVGVASTVSGTPTVNSITVGGVSATQLVTSTDTNQRVGLWIATVPTGTTADVVVTHSASQDRCAVVVWAAYDLQSSTATATASDNAPALSQSLTINAGGIAVGFADGYQFNSGTESWSWTGLTEVIDNNVNDGTNYDYYSGASLASAAGSTPTVTATKTGSDTNDNMVLAALR